MSFASSLAPSRRPHILHAVVVLLILSLAISGCSRRGEGAASGGAAPAEPIDTPAAATDAPEPTAAPKEAMPTEEPAAEQTAAEEPAASESAEQAQSPLDPPPAAESPLDTPEVNISPLDTPAQSASPLATPAVTAIEADITAGASYVRGRLVSGVTGEVLSGAVIRLPEVLCDPVSDPESEGAETEEETAANDGESDEGCFWVLSDALTAATMTDETGAFEFADLKAGDYVLLVGDLMTVYAFAEDEGEKPFQFTAPADGGVDLGDVVVAYE